MNIQFAPILPYAKDILEGLWMSISVTMSSMLAGMIIGLITYIGRTGRNRLLKRIAIIYIEVFRNTPLLVQLYMIYFGLAQFRIDMSPFATAFFAMTVNTGAYLAEILRSGFDSVSAGTVEAGHALAMNELQIFVHVKLKPALRSAFPAIINQLIMLFLFSSVASVISLNELTYVTKNIDTRIARTFELYLLSGVLYYVTSFLLIKVLGRFEKRIFKW